MGRLESVFLQKETMPWMSLDRCADDGSRPTWRSIGPPIGIALSRRLTVTWHPNIIAITKSIGGSHLVVAWREGNRWLSSVGADDGWQKTLDVTTLLRPVKIHFAGASRCCALHYSSKNTEDRLGNGEKQNAIPRRATTSTPFLFSPLSHIKNIVDDRWRPIYW